MIDVITISIVVFILIAAMTYVIKARKRGIKCIGCSQCTSCKGCKTGKDETM